jgi:hypothetical protein
MDNTITPTKRKNQGNRLAEVLAAEQGKPTTNRLSSDDNPSSANAAGTFGGLDSKKRLIVKIKKPKDEVFLIKLLQRMREMGFFLLSL